MFEHQRLHFCGPNLEAAGIDHALESVGHEKIAFFIDAAHVARSEERFAISLKEGTGSGFWSFPVAFENLWSRHDNFTRFTLGQLFQSFWVYHARIHAHERNSQTLFFGCIRWVGV